MSQKYVLKYSFRWWRGFCCSWWIYTRPWNERSSEDFSLEF